MTEDHLRFVISLHPVVSDTRVSEPANRAVRLRMSSEPGRGASTAPFVQRKCKLSLRRRTFLTRIAEAGADLGISADAEIPTKRGLVPLGDISLTDRLITWSGYQRLTCCRPETLSPADLEMFPELRPIRLPSSLLGNPRATRALGLTTVKSYVLVSPGTQILVDSDLIHELTGYRKVFITARSLLSLEGVSVETSCRKVTYVQPITRAQEIFNSAGFRIATPLDEETLQLLLFGAKYQHAKLRLERERESMSEAFLASLAPTLSPRTAESVIRAHQERKIPLLRPGTPSC